jgi:hypothetical protein
MQITGDVTVTLTISSGRIVAAHANGPAILASAAASRIRANWVPLQIPAAPMNCRSSFGWIDNGVRIGNVGLLISGLRPEGIRIGPRNG